MQHYAYTAYGIAIGFDEAQALTALLYSGEAFDSRVGLQYLRARWYDPNFGRFNRLDPFSGNLRDPQSLHKYLYTHGDPVNGIDPTGLMTYGDVMGVLTVMGTGFAIGVSTNGLRNGALGLPVEDDWWKAGVKGAVFLPARFKNYDGRKSNDEKKFV
ncbi:tRNA(Glu)-specific nuclease WapA precursor [Symmachiella macrocystis]|uniref:tRNA(Glu)-specific nuclease WapA n=1 Tax=Symmachiella macrocystis TaxID=2527985 RepID=A0A5C6BB11_9PLAN|nr:RHS repeat-associated core domain-containing protein [Symmachiella macrocystis]TWU08631.1 tRNA(Glu)-specific nuclease WapA precursor [Symmachiella macrocystis]